MSNWHKHPATVLTGNLYHALWDDFSGGVPI